MTERVVGDHSGPVSAPTVLTLDRERAARAEALRKEVARQVDRLVNLGYPTMLDLTEAEYRAQLVLPAGTERPEEYRDRFPYPLVVDPRVTLEQLTTTVQAGRYNPMFDSSVEFYDDLKSRAEKDPEDPYLAWVHLGKRYRSDSLFSAQEKFSENEVGSNLIEGIALYLQYGKDPRLTGTAGIIAGGIKGYCCDLEKRISNGNGVLIQQTSSYWLHAYAWSSAERPDFSAAGILTRGKEIVTLGSAAPVVTKPQPVQ